ncbi:uncharacterized protein LOC131859350 [Cryptomeria japonica]|uniref:uncharacterized protein LOC131859350 n=1 Tax=Cryptomeria japonica TaxID=3369 RepID=UPI0027DAABC7|nr:uncharacterized protein LOC131859350 [Cryptomeria japonica]
MKVNFDGASQGNLGPSGVGFIVEDWNGHVMFFGAKKLDSGTNNIAEVFAALMVVKFSRQAGVSKLHLEGDSLVIIQAIMKGSIEARHLQNAIINIIEELNKFDDYKISHVNRMGNKEADVLSKWALSFNEIGEFIFEDMRYLSFDD